MNCLEQFLDHVHHSPQKTSLCFSKEESCSFSELESMAAQTQEILKKYDLQPGDGVLVFDSLSIRLYAVILGILASGLHAIFVEPWMALPDLQHAIKASNPKLFLTNFPGRLWGWMIPEIRAIPTWKSIGAIKNQRYDSRLTLNNIPEDTLGMVTFTTGRMDLPKGMVHTHGQLQKLIQTIATTFEVEHFQGPDLCSSTNAILTNLSYGRCSIVIPSYWDKKFFYRLKLLPSDIKPETMTCGPLFLESLLEDEIMDNFHAINIGGALTNCNTFKKGFERWPQAHWKYIYESNETGPVAVVDAKEAVERSQEQGFFQTLFLGKPLPKIQYKIQEEGIWVTAPHTCNLYIGTDEANKQNKYKDDQGTIWHYMGDRILIKENEWWYGGRSQQNYEEFILEQEIYAFIQSNHAFIHRAPSDKLYLIGENITDQSHQIVQKFHQLSGIVEGKIYHYPRQPASINRKRSILETAPWIASE